MSEVSVKNFDEMRLAMKKELKILSDKLAKSLKAAQSMNPDIGAYEIMKIENLQNVLSQMVSMYDHILSQINLCPNITVEQEGPEIQIPEIKIPEIRLPDITVPEAKVTVNNEFDVERIINALTPLKNLSRNPTSPIAVRLSDGKKFIEALKQATQEISSAADKMGGIVFSGGGGGMTSDEFKLLGGRLGTDYIFDGSAKLTPKFSKISASTMGNNTIVSAVTGKKIRVLQMDLISSGDVNVKFQDGAGGTDITGLSYLSAYTGLVRNFSPVGWFETSASTLLNLNLSASQAVGGSLVYIEV